LISTIVWTLGPVIAGVALVITFVLIERRTGRPLLPLSVILDRARGGAYLSVGISGTGGFAVFLFLTYYLAETLKVTPLQTGVTFLPLSARPSPSRPPTPGSPWEVRYRPSRRGRRGSAWTPRPRS
jgi:hypothetical protein